MEHNQKIIKPMTLITRKYVTAIQPLGPLEQKELEKLVKLYTPTTTQIIKEYIRDYLL